MSENVMDRVNNWLPLVAVASFVLGLGSLVWQATAAVGELREMKTATERLGTKIDGLGTKLEMKIDGLGTKIDGLGTKIDRLGKKIDDFKAIVLREFDRNKSKE